MFRATEVLAKHDENYMPPEAAAAVDQAHARAAMDKAAKTLKPMTAATPPRATAIRMIPELGHFALILALLLAALLGTLPLVGAARGIPAWTALARPLAAGPVPVRRVRLRLPRLLVRQQRLLGANVATNSNSQLPLQYRIAATWGSHEGSMLLWVFMLGGWTVAVALKSRHLPDEMVARVLGVMGLVVGRLPAVHAAHVEPVRPAVSAAPPTAAT